MGTTAFLLERFESRNRNLIDRNVGRLSGSQSCQHTIGNLDDVATAVDVASCDKLHGGQIGLHAHP